MSARTFGFGLKAFKRFPELIPLAVIMGTTSTMATAFVIYSLKTKPDVRVMGRNVEMPYELVKPTESRKMININQKYEPIPELEALRKEIGSYKN